MSALRIPGRARLAAFGAIFVLLSLLSAHPRAAEVKLGSLVILDAWARATPAANGAAYVTVRNDGDAPDSLVGVATDAAKMAHLHESKNDNGVMQMRALAGIDIPPHQTVTLSPGGTHVMLMGLAAPLKEGGSFPLTLTFQKAGAVTVTVAVKAAGATGDMKDMGDMK